MEDYDLWKKYDTIGIKLALILKKNLIANMSTIIFEKKKKSQVDEATDFHDKEMPKAGPNHTCLAVIIVGSAVNKDENCYLQVFLKVFSIVLNTLQKKIEILDILLKT